MRMTTDYSNGVLTVRFCGELDHCAASDALKSVEAAGEEYMPRQCVLDFSQLSFMDSSGIAVILRSERLLQQNGTHIRITGCNRQVRSVLELSGLSEMISEEPIKREECELI